MPIRLLLTDDHQIVLDGLRAMLANESRLEIAAEARNGQEALAALEVLKIDLVLLDIDMPVMEGFETTRLIRRRFPDVRIIILSMHDERSMITKLVNAGADGYVLKNADKQSLLTAIDDVMAGKKHLSMQANAILLSAAKPTDAGLHGRLTEREIEVLQLKAEGLSNKEIGDRLFISHRTVDTHRTNLMTKLEVHNVAGLVRFAIQNGLAGS